MRTMVVESDPPRRIVTETKTRLSCTQITRDYSAHEGGTRVQITTVQHVRLAAWLTLPIYAREVKAALADGERRLRQALLDDVTAEPRAPGDLGHVEAPVGGAGASP